MVYWFYILNFHCFHNKNGPFILNVDENFPTLNKEKIRDGNIYHPHSTLLACRVNLDSHKQSTTKQESIPSFKFDTSPMTFDCPIREECMVK